jgi:hypothetical protein
MLELIPMMPQLLRRPDHIAGESGMNGRQGLAGLSAALQPTHNLPG